MTIDVMWRDDTHAALEERIVQVCETVLAALGVSQEAELSVLLTDDEEISELNQAYRDETDATDVLSFPLQEGEGAGIHDALGDVVISMPYATRQASARGWNSDAEIVFLLVHGILHLLGRDHQTPDEAAAMEAETASIWALLSPDIPLPTGFLIEP